MRYSSKIFASQIYSKGCDASNEHNEEIDENHQEFSDDEQERKAKSQQKRKPRKRKRSNSNVQNPNPKRQMIKYEAEFSIADNTKVEINNKYTTPNTASELLDKNEEGILMDNNNSEVGFFAPLQPIEDDEEDINWNKSVILRKK